VGKKFFPLAQVAGAELLIASAFVHRQGGFDAMG
jgi:hypothetical protein